jgi:DNA-binding Lrp family transcriptional regulator
MGASDDSAEAFDGTLLRLGIEPDDERVYRQVLRRSPARTEVIAEVVGLAPAALDDVVDRLVDAGVVRREHGFVVAVHPERLLTALVEGEADRLRTAFERLEVLRHVLPSLVSDHQAGPGPAGDHVVIEAMPYDDVVPLLQQLAESSNGDLLWLRPDQWRIEAGRQVDRWVKPLLAAGRQSRVIYPARVLEVAPEVVRARADVGEKVRVLATVPARMAIFGSFAAVIHEDWHAVEGRLMVIRQPSLVEMATMLFEHLWDRALNVPGFEVANLSAELLGSRRLLLDQLARGAKDEQIARSLGLSLRTVRRRVAAIMDELGADSRFQAGVEAVRRGWI